MLIAIAVFAEGFKDRFNCFRLGKQDIAKNSWSYDFQLNIFLLENIIWKLKSFEIFGYL